MVNKVVARFIDGSIIKGTTCDFSPNKKLFHLGVKDGNVIEICLAELKAIFFVKDFEGNKTYSEAYEDIVPGGGRKAQVTFIDGESIVGYALSYSADRQGFFLVPADKKSNNERIFVITASGAKVKFL